jgi:hypothetical protein
MVQKLFASENTGHCQVGFEGGGMTTLRGDFFVM